VPGPEMTIPPARVVVIGLADELLNLIVVVLTGLVELPVLVGKAVEFLDAVAFLEMLVVCAKATEASERVTI